MVNMDHVHGPWSLTSITKIFLLGGYGTMEHGPWSLTSITKLFFCGGYRTMEHGPCSMFQPLTPITKFKMLGRL